MKSTEERQCGGSPVKNVQPEWRVLWSRKSTVSEWLFDGHQVPSKPVPRGRQCSPEWHHHHRGHTPDVYAPQQRGQQCGPKARALRWPIQWAQTCDRGTVPGAIRGRSSAAEWKSTVVDTWPLQRAKCVVGPAAPTAAGNFADSLRHVPEVCVVKGVNGVKIKVDD